MWNGYDHLFLSALNDSPRKSSCKSSRPFDMQRYEQNVCCAFCFLAFNSFYQLLCSCNIIYDDGMECKKNSTRNNQVYTHAHTSTVYKNVRIHTTIVDETLKPDKQDHIWIVYWKWVLSHSVYAHIECAHIYGVLCVYAWKCVSVRLSWLYFLLN